MTSAPGRRQPTHWPAVDSGVRWRCSGCWTWVRKRRSVRQGTAWEPSARLPPVRFWSGGMRSLQARRRGHVHMRGCGSPTRWARRLRAVPTATQRCGWRRRSSHSWPCAAPQSSAKSPRAVASGREAAAAIRPQPAFQMPLRTPRSGRRGRRSCCTPPSSSRSGSSAPARAVGRMPARTQRGLWPLRHAATRCASRSRAAAIRTTATRSRLDL